MLTNTMLAPSGDRAVPALSDFWFGMKLSFVYCHSGACSNNDRAVPTALYCLIFGHCQLLYCHNDVCSKWRQGGAGITELSDFVLRKLR